MRLMASALLSSLFLLLATAGAASAGPVDDRTRGLYERGIAEYQAGEFAAAIRSFEAAYELQPSSQLLFNLAQVHRQRGDVRGALRYYHRYLERASDPAALGDVHAIIAQLEQRRRTAMVVTTPGPLPSRPDLVRQSTAPHRSLTHEGAIALVASTAMLGGVLLGGGLGLSLRAAGRAEDLDAALPLSRWDEGQRARYDDGVSSSRAATALYVLGASTVAASAISAIVFRRQLARRGGEARRRMAWAF